MPAFTSRPNAFTQSAVEATNLSCVGNTAEMTFSRDSAANLSRIEQLRKELGGSITPSKEIEERAATQQQCKCL